ncbi:MAG: outer membrane protein assembly factor BamB, partial [Myxococcota bacterium]
ALAAGRVLAVTLDGQLGGLLLGSAQPTTLSAATVGAKPFSPVVGERDIIYVASGASKHVHAIRYEGQVPVAGWTGGATTSPQLPDVPVGAALAGGGGRIYVPLLNGELVALDAGDGELIWRYALDGTPQGTPLASPKGGVLLLSGGRLARVYAPTAPAPDAPWPRRRHDAGSTALGAF